MNHSFIIGLSVAYFGLCGVSWYVLLFRPDWSGEFDYYFGPVYAVGSFFLAVDSLLKRDWFSAVLFSIYCLIGAWWWWNNDDHKRRRRKLLDRSSGVVRDLGGRLKVVRPAEH